MTGAEVAKVRADLGLTQEKLAAMMKVSVRTISRWESEGPPEWATVSLFLIAGILRRTESDGHP